MTRPDTLELWADTVCQELDLQLRPSPELITAVLDLTRDVAHGVARPAAPVTAFLVGLALANGPSQPDTDRVSEVAARISAMAAHWLDPHE